MHVTHVIPYLGRAMGGPVSSVAAYADALVENQWQVTVAGIRQPGDGETVSFGQDVRVLQYDRALGGMFRYSRAFADALSNLEANVIHSHGLWTYASIAAARAGQRKKTPHVIAPCGMLQPGALNRSAWKKRICRLLFQNRILRAADCIHAKSSAEKESIRAYGLKNPIAVIPNPVPMCENLEETDDSVFRRKHGLGDKRVVLFLGRIHPVKGLERLVRAWAELTERSGNWTLVLAGPDEHGHGRELRTLAEKLGCGGDVHLTGNLQGQEKDAALKTADLFVMPSDFENFGSSIVEAMGGGLPVITTTGTPWREIKDRNAGWYVERGVAPLQNALQQAVRMDQNERARMGGNGKKIARRFVPAAIGGDLAALYEWLLGIGPRPGCVEGG